MSIEYSNEICYYNPENRASCYSVDVWLSRNPSVTRRTEDCYWIIFIHGGAWHDPQVESSFADAAVNKLRQIDNVAGFASINYRLSPYPTHPTSPSPPYDPSRNAVHPDHLEDVLAGIRYLQKRFHFQNRYVLVGHSCGATLAFQTVMTSHLLPRRDALDTDAQDPVHVPDAIVGIAGLYDLVLLRDMDAEPRSCHSFLSLTFGPKEEKWKAASPVSGDYRGLWKEGRLVILATCEEDQHVPLAQSEAMAAVLRTWASGDRKTLKKMVIKGSHDDVWENGDGMADCVNQALSFLLDKSIQL